MSPVSTAGSVIVGMPLSQPTLDAVGGKPRGGAIDHTREKLSTILNTAEAGRHEGEAHCPKLSAALLLCCFAVYVAGLVPDRQLSWFDRSGRNSKRPARVRAMRNQAFLYRPAKTSS